MNEQKHRRGIMKVLVLGSEGFIGKQLLNALASRSFDAVGLSKTDGLDLADIENAREYIEEKQPDIIYNFAAHVGSVHYGLKHPATIFHDNMLMILNLFKIVSEVSKKIRLINPISNCVYPMDADIQVESEMWKGMPHPSALPYAASRRMIYVISKSYFEQYGIVSTNLILPGVYGPGNHTDIERVHALDGIIIRMIASQKSGDTEFKIWGSGSPIREWCYIDDIVNLAIKVMDIEVDLIEPVNIGQNKGYSIRELAEITAHALGYKGKLVFDTTYPDGAAVKVLDNTKFCDVFSGYQFKDIKEGIRNAVDYYKSVL